MSGPGEAAVTPRATQVGTPAAVCDSGDGGSTKRRRTAPSPRGGGGGPWQTPPPPGAASGASLRPCGPLSSSARKKTPLSPGSRTQGGSSSGKSVRFPRRVAVILGCAEALDRTPHELPCTCDAAVTCDGAYILGVHYQCTACSDVSAGAEGDSFDLCGKCFAAWGAAGREWPHKHGMQLFVIRAVNVTGIDGDDGGCDDVNGADGEQHPTAGGAGVSDLLEGSRGLGPRLRLSEEGT